MQIKDSVAIITGSSSGIGAAVAELFAQNGAHVIINYSSNEAGAQEVADRCRAFGVKTLVKKADVSDDRECRALVDAAVDTFGRLDVLVNNAGTTKFCDHADLSGLEKQDFLNLYATNTVGAFQMARAAEPFLRKQPTAHIINMASIAALTGVGTSIAYAASKGALVTMTLSLARVLGPQIRVNAVCPGFVQGDWLKNNLGQEIYDMVLAGMQESAPLRDTATPERVAEVVLGIINGMDWVTGETIIVDGGTHLQTAPLRR